MNYLDLEHLHTIIDLEKGAITGGSSREVRLSAIKDFFVDKEAVQRVLEHDDPVIYTVSGIEPASGDGQLHYGLGKISPGKIGEEYYITKGHFHTVRAAAEIYIGLSGRGMMLLEEEESGPQEQVVPELRIPPQREKQAEAVDDDGQPGEERRVLHPVVNDGIVAPVGQLDEAGPGYVVP